MPGAFFKKNESDDIRAGVHTVKGIVHKGQAAYLYKHVVPLAGYLPY
jgi:hypothetical protein